MSEEAEAKTYKIVRFYQNHDNETVQTGVTLEEAKAHCDDPDTSWRSATSAEALQRTKDKGPWFDGFEEE